MVVPYSRDFRHLGSADVHLKASLIHVYALLTIVIPKAVVVFDGYMSGPSTKDMTHLRQSKGVNGNAVHFTPNIYMVLRSTKEQFLANAENKQRFIFALGASLEKICTVIHAKADADLQIVLTATESANFKSTAAVKED